MLGSMLRRQMFAGQRRFFSAAPAKVIKMTVISDSVCPWCFIGKRSYEAALARLPKSNLSSKWLPYFLNTDLPPEGYKVTEFWKKKTGMTEKQLRSPVNPINKASKKAGIALNWDRVAVDTTDSHCLIALAEEQGLMDDMVEELFIVFFERAENISDLDILCAAADKVGVKGAREALENKTLRDKILEEEKECKERAKGVPHFIIEVEDRKLEIPGSATEDDFLEAFQKIWNADGKKPVASDTPGYICGR